MLEVVSPGVFYGFAIAFGLVVGSFLNVVIYRLPRGESIVHPGSHCPSCDAPVKPWDNLPVVSYLLLRGRCRACGQRIALRYPAVELGNGLLFGALAWQFGPSWMALLFMGLVAALWVAALVDLDHQIIPDSISLGGAVVGLVFMPLVGAHSGTPYGESLLTSFLGAVVGGGTLWSIAFLHARLSVALGRQFPHWPGEGESPPGPRDADYWLWF
ncbi:MAG: prepilin peptidase, partial [Myxococcota bacterium]